MGEIDFQAAGAETVEKFFAIFFVASRDKGRGGARRIVRLFDWVIGGLGGEGTTEKRNPFRFRTKNGSAGDERMGKRSPDRLNSE